MTYLATAALLLTIASLIPIGGVIFTPFLLGLFLIALVGVVSDHGDRTVRRQGPTLDGRAWRNRHREPAK